MKLFIWLQLSYKTYLLERTKKMTDLKTKDLLKKHSVSNSKFSLKLNNPYEVVSTTDRRKN